MVRLLKYRLLFSVVCCALSISIISCGTGSADDEYHPGLGLPSISITERSALTAPIEGYIGETAEATLYLTNSGSATANNISVDELSIPFGFKGGSFPGTGGTCTPSLNGGSTCSFVVTFTPSSTERVTSQIRFRYYTGASSLIYEDTLTAVGAYEPPSIASITVNGGPNVTLRSTLHSYSVAGQYSAVKQILVTFDRAVTVATGAFSITPRTTNVRRNSGTAPSTSAVTASFISLSSTQYLITFSGAGTWHNVINSGIYNLTTDASKVSANGVSMAANQTNVFFALYGAISGNISLTTGTLGDGASTVVVNAASWTAFSATFNSDSSQPEYNIAFDYQLDGYIDGIDFSGYTSYQSTSWSF